MNHTIVGLAVMVTLMGATAARADDCGPMPQYAPAGQNWNSGRYQLQTTQVWVPGTTQQVWTPGTCNQVRSAFGYMQRCTRGYYRTVVTAGHYENRQNWVWVANYEYRNGNRYGNRWNNGNGNRRSGRHGAVPVGY